MMRYNYSISHVPGKLLYTALSRAPASGNHEDSTSLQNETEFVAAMVSNFPATSDCLVEFWKAQAADQTLSKVINFCQTKWPAELAVSATLKPYWKIQDELSVCKQLLLRGDRIVIPSCLQEDILQHLHQGHQGIVKCKLHARNSVWWQHK